MLGKIKRFFVAVKDGVKRKLRKEFVDERPTAKEAAKGLWDYFWVVLTVEAGRRWLKGGWGWVKDGAQGLRQVARSPLTWRSVPKGAGRVAMVVGGAVAIYFGIKKAREIARTWKAGEKALASKTTETVEAVKA